MPPSLEWSSLLSQHFSTRGSGLPCRTSEDVLLAARYRNLKENVANWWNWDANGCPALAGNFGGGSPLGSPPCVRQPSLVVREVPGGFTIRFSVPRRRVPRGRHARGASALGAPEPHGGGGRPGLDRGRRKGPVQSCGATSRTVFGIAPCQPGLVVVAPDGHRTRTRRSGFPSAEPKNTAAVDWL